MEKLLSGDIIYNIDDYPYENIGKSGWISKRGKYRHEYYERPATFDIETTSINCEKPFGFMYVWQFSLEKKVCIGRTWSEWQTFMQRLQEALQLKYPKTLVIYSHLLAFEFQFFRGFIKVDQIFAKDARKVMKVNCGAFEFRCSYYLSNMSLEKFCENSVLCTHHKKSGEDFDYSIRRYPDTPLTDEEKQYCVNDVLGLEECIDSLLLDDTIASIPLTSTGYVRRDCKKAMSKNRKNRNNFIKTALELEQYLFIKKVFRGGDTHASRFFTDVHLYNLDSYDIQSSYPAWIMTDYFPVGRLVPFKMDDSVKPYCKKYCCFMLIAFFNIEVYPREPHTYIDVAHCKRYRGLSIDNGRVKSAEYIEYYCTEIDLKILEECYDYKGWKLIKGYYTKRGQLPKELKKVVMNYYEGKTSLKGIDEKIYEYMKSKNKLNAIFGMMVSALIHEEWILNSDWREGNEEKAWTRGKEDEQAKRDDLHQFYHGFSGFLTYQWGIYITAHARERLHEGIKACKNEKGLSSAVYWDTDSVKFLQNPEIESRFEKMNELRMKECSCAEISPMAINKKKGEECYMGIWEKEKHILEFKTYGAKKYCTITEEKNWDEEKLKRKVGEDRIFTTTVAGMNKQKGAERMVEMAAGKNPIDECFCLGKIFHHVGRTTAYYNDDAHPHYIQIDGREIYTAANIGLIESTYQLGITGDYQRLIYEDETKAIQEELLEKNKKG